MRAHKHFRECFTRRLSMEHLERRICLAGDGVVDDPAPCLLDVDTSGDAARAARAVNCFAFDLYEHVQNEQGNLFFSPLSIATGLAMTYAGAALETAEQMEAVLHLGNEPGIHTSFSALLSFFEWPRTIAGFELEVANGLWPREGLPMHEDFARIITADYVAEAQSLDYSQPDQAADVINSWTSEKTRGRVEKLVEELDPLTTMVLTNSVYFSAPWDSPFDPNNTGLGWVSPHFYREDGETVEVSMMLSQDSFPYAEIDGFQVLDMPFEGGGSSMVFILSQERDGANELTPELLVQIDDWLKGPRDTVEFGLGVAIPKFQTTVSTQLEQLLSDMGMPLAFSAGADFTAMTDAPAYIDEVRHKAFLEVNEQGTEAGAATSVELWLCFAAGTPVLTPDGEKPIERLKVGDYVLSRDEHNVEGPIEPRRVEAVSNDDAKLVEISVGGQSIRATHAHPFFVKGQGWTPASELRAGDLLATNRSDWMEVERISMPEGTEPVFNLRVAGHHTYFVGSESWGFAVWAHNFYVNEFHADHTFHFLIRDNASSALLFMGRVSDPSQTENSLRPSVARVLGDSNRDGVFDQVDIAAVLQAGKYLTGEAATFEEGDWNDDGVFDQRDVVAALQTGNYLEGAYAAHHPQLTDNPAAADKLFACVGD